MAGRDQTQDVWIIKNVVHLYGPLASKIELFTNVCHCETCGSNCHFGMRSPNSCTLSGVHSDIFKNRVVVDV